MQARGRFRDIRGNSIARNFRANTCKTRRNVLTVRKRGIPQGDNLATNGNGKAKTKSKKKRTGRPTTYTEAIGKEICEKLSCGMSLTKICKASKMPDRATVYDWRSEHAAFDNGYARAREMYADSVFDDLFTLADDTDPDDVQVARLQIDVRKWVLARMCPKKYSDYQKVEIDGTLTINMVSDPVLDGKS